VKEHEYRSDARFSVFKFRFQTGFKLPSVEYSHIFISHFHDDHAHGHHNFVLMVPVLVAKARTSLSLMMVPVLVANAGTSLSLIMNHTMNIRFFVFVLMVGTASASGNLVTGPTPTDAPSSSAAPTPQHPNSEPPTCDGTDPIALCPTIVCPTIDSPSNGNITLNLIAVIATCVIAAFGFFSYVAQVEANEIARDANKIAREGNIAQRDESKKAKLEATFARDESKQAQLEANAITRDGNTIGREGISLTFIALRAAIDRHGS
jgi:hypothetical protein